jgi:hypothetical protein
MKVTPGSESKCCGSTRTATLLSQHLLLTCFWIENFSFVSAHGVHLAVLDVLYKKPEIAFDDEEAEDDSNSSQGLDDEEELLDENFILERNPADAVLPDLTSTYKSVIDTVRDVVKFFRYDIKIGDKEKQNGNFKNI